jgi:hypothetical protein
MQWLSRSGDADDSQGAWIFLSHSHRDIEQVRWVRNLLEDRGHNPLMFFLKGIDDDSELDYLIRREIEARDWFLLCDSENARASRWVQAETEFIKSLEGKVYETIDLNDHPEIKVERALGLAKRATVFLSYRRSYMGVASMIMDVLSEHDYALAQVEAVAIESGMDGLDIETVYMRKIDAALEDGFVLLLLGPDILDAVWMRGEVDYLLSKASTGKSNVVPIVVRNWKGTLARLQEEGHPVREMRFADLTTFSDFRDLRESVEELVRELKRRPME